MDKKLQDLAWSILPKEFKEEVKKAYKIATKGILSGAKTDDVSLVDYSKGWVHGLEEAFGEHNLTSDAEGEEDEKLYIKRKWVQEMYKNNCDEIRRENISSSDKDCYEYANEVLKTLFGSKCLPDNVDSSEPNVDSLEPKPFKYSVGQKVILHFYGGEVSTITEAFNDGGVWNKYKVKMLPNRVWNENELDPYDEPKPAEPKFKVGDKVLRKYHDYEDNELPYDIFEGYHGKDKRGYICGIKANYWLIPESDLEPYTEPEEEITKMKLIESKVSVYLATQEEDEEFRLLLHRNGFTWNTSTPLINLTCWDSLFEDNKIHYVHPDKTVTNCGEKISDTLTFSEFKKQYFGENVNHRQFIANCDKQFDNIHKDGFAKERRLSIATNVLGDIIKSQYYSLSEDYQEENISEMAEVSVRLADALIAECEKGGNNA